MRSLLAPLLIGLVLSLVVVFGVQWSATHAAIDAGMRDYIVGHSKQDADELYGALAFQPGGEVSLALRHFDPVYLARDSGHYFQIMMDGTIALRSPSLAGQSLAVEPVAPGGQVVQDIDGPNGQRLLVGAFGYAFQGRPLTIAMATDLAPVHAEYSKLLRDYTRVTIVMFGLLVVLQVVIVRVALSPLRRVQAEVRRLERGETAQLSEAVPVEVLPLVHEINQLLARLAQRLQHSRESLGNLAHALKAPLAVLTHMASDEHIRRHPTLGSEMIEQLRTLRERIDSELRRARVAGGHGSGPALDLAVEIGALLSTMRRLYPHRNLDLSYRIESGVRCPGDREDMLEICGNLLDNACKWARSRVVFSARGGNGTVLTIEDDGPGCSAEDLERIAQRGVRLDESTEGHGLGLAIARNVASSYGATLEFGRSETLGGFRVTVAFPPA